MRKLLCGLIILSICISLFSTSIVYAANEEKDQIIVTDEEINDDSSQDDKDLAISEAIDIEDYSNLKDETDADINALDEYGTINGDNFIEFSSSLFSFLAKRGLYYKSTMNALDRVNAMKHNDLKKIAILKFEENFKKDILDDKNIQQKFVRLLEFIKNNNNEIKPKKKLKSKEIIKKLLRKYHSNRKVLNYINNIIKSKKLELVNSEILELTNKANNAEVNGNSQEAVTSLKKAFEYNTLDKEQIIRLGRLLINIEGIGPKVYVMGREPKFDVKPQILNGRTLVPVRAIAEALNTTSIDWNAEKRLVTIKKDDKILKLYIDQTVYFVNEVNKDTDVPAQIIDGRTMVPLRLVSEVFETKVDYDAETMMITINDEFCNEENNISQEKFTETTILSEEEAKVNVTEGATVNNIKNLESSDIDDEISSINDIADQPEEEDE